MVHVSDAAARQIQRLLSDEGRSDAFIRVSVKSGGCSGLSYDFGFVDAPEEGDQTFEEQGVKMLVEKKSLLYLLGTTLDFNAYYSVTKKVRIFAEVNNLTNQPLRYFQNNKEYTMQAEYYGLRANLGVKWDL